MDENIVLNICNIISEKIDLFLQYKNYTDQLAGSPFNDLNMDHLQRIQDMDETIDHRQRLVDQINDKTRQINPLANQYPEIKKILSFGDYPGTDKNFLKLVELCASLKEILKQIADKDKLVEARFDKCKNELTEQLQQARKSKQIIDYADSIGNTDLFNGQTFNEKT